jgi:hypothetical protein
MTTEADALILRYLQHLESQLGDLPANRRQELLDEVQEHITTARADLDPETEAGVLTLLERLGDPADIAAEARDRSGVQAQPARPATPWLEITTIVLLVIPFLGWVLGAVLVWLSRLWTTRDKLVGTVGGLSWVLAAWGRHGRARRRPHRAGRRGRRHHRPQPARGHPGRGAVRSAAGRRHLPGGPAAGRRPDHHGLGFGTLEQEPAAFSIAGRQVRRGPARTASCAASTAR